MEKFRVEKVHALLKSHPQYELDNNQLQDIAQYIKKEVRRFYPDSTPPDNISNPIH